VIDMAERGGVDPAVLRAIVARDFAAMPNEVALVVRFTEAHCATRRRPTNCVKTWCDGSANAG
jgi:hypothetical protein